jgi:linoleoyl-CoA desaturase
MIFSGPRYNRASLPEFYPTLRARVSAYFTENNISRHANAAMVTKTIVLLLVYLVPLGLMYSGMISNHWVLFGMWILMGMGMAGIGMSVMHDANHGAYSRNETVNRALGYLLNLVGGNADFWKIQHNVLHHTYTNVEGADEDIHVPLLLRFSPTQKRYWVHRFQHIYAFFLYGLMTMPWISTKEFQQLASYRKRGLIPGGKPFRNLLIRSIFSKIIYHLVILVLPLLLIPVSPWFTLMCFLSMHFVAAFLLGLIFQTAHVMPDCVFPVPDDEGNMETNWAVHQLLTTTNYAPKSRIFSWFVGGLNYQVEHHLFPNICHVHYKKISKIVANTAQEYGLPYNSQRNFIQAIIEHGKMLYALGNFDDIHGALSPVKVRTQQTEKHF